jgi:single-strand selective monofunctional uracil DNA glycosylase
MSLPLLIREVRALSAAVEALRFGEPVDTVYNPLTYARSSHEDYLTRYAMGRKRVLFVGMNPGPWGMAQTGVPFGEVGFVRDWMGIRAAIGKPQREHPKRPVLGFDCPRSEVSGRRLWGLFAERFGTPEAFFAEHAVMNYCPLLFLSGGGGNLTPDKLPAHEAEALRAVCDRHLAAVLARMKPEFLIGVGAFAEGRLRAVGGGAGARVIGRILHPSPASPAANRDWAGAATRQLRALGVWNGA